MFNSLKGDKVLWGILALLAILTIKMATKTENTSFSKNLYNGVLLLKKTRTIKPKMEIT